MAADSIQITASLRIERPVDVVRAQYRDIDHHIRNNVHPSIRYQWEPGEPGERKIRTTFSILGVPQYDVSLLEDGEDGSFIIRYLEGSNAGMVLVHKFVPIGDTATDVQLSAEAPATVGRKLLGPLFVAGARQVMKKALAEDKRDIEGGSYRPGTAAGNIEGALGFLRDVSKKEGAAKRSVIEAACLVSASDGEVDAAERDAIIRLAGLVGVHGEELWIDSRLEDFKRASSSEKIAEEADLVGDALDLAKVASEGIGAAAAIALVTEGLSLGELAILRRIAVAAKLPEEMLVAIVDGADAALSRRLA